jgi:hypothetical protein
LGPPQDWGYYGTQLPWSVRHLSATGRIVGFGDPVSTRFALGDDWYWVA